MFIRALGFKDLKYKKIDVVLSFEVVTLFALFEVARMFLCINICGEIKFFSCYRKIRWRPRETDG